MHSSLFGLRNLDGGSHYDEEILDPNYAAITGTNFMHVRRRDGRYHTVRQLELATTRQVAWELLESIEKHELSFG